MNGAPSSTGLGETLRTLTGRHPPHTMLVSSSSTPVLLNTLSLFPPPVTYVLAPL